MKHFETKRSVNDSLKSSKFCIFVNSSCGKTRRSSHDLQSNTIFPHFWFVYGCPYTTSYGNIDCISILLSRNTIINESNSRLFIVVLVKFKLSSNNNFFKAYKCNTLRGTPTQFVDLVDHPERSKLNLSSLENAIIGASTVPPDLLQKMKAELKIKGNDILFLP